MTRFKATVDVSADAVYMFDPGSLRLTYVNRGGADLLGSPSRATLVGTERARAAAGRVGAGLPRPARRPARGARPRR